MNMFKPVRKSDWKFNTSGTGGLGIGLFVIAGGELRLDDPDGQTRVLRYGGAGVGMSVGVRRLPKLGRFVDPKGLSDSAGGAIAPESFPNGGIVYVMEGCRTNDLIMDDFKGICIYYDIGIGVVAGYAAQGMLMNCDRVAFACLMSGNPVLSEIAFINGLRPHAMLLSWGPNIGLQANAGVSESAGYVS